MPNRAPETKFDHLPDWIKQLRSQSWQIEMLIAGSAVYTLYYLSDYIRSWFYYIYPGLDFSLAKTLMLFGIYLVSRILLVGFIGNLIIRSVWLAYLGINFAFPEGINFDNLKNHPESKELLKSQPTILDRVSFLERLSKLSYSISILLAIFTTSIFITTTFIHTLLEKINFGTIIYEAWFSYTLAILIAIVQLGVIDRFFLSKKSKRPWINKLKRVLSVGLEYLTLSFLFRREFLTIKSNTNRWALGISTTFILGLASIITSYQLGKYWSTGTLQVNILNERKFFDVDLRPTLPIYNYDTNITMDKSVLRASIQSEVIKDRYLKLFVTSWERFDKKLEHSYKKFNYPVEYEPKDSDDLFQAQDQADSTFNLVINDLFTVEIDQVKQEGLRWRTTNHPKSKTKGYITYIDIEHLENSEHKVILFVNYFGRKNKIKKGRWKDITFWKQ